MSVATCLHLQVLIFGCKPSERWGKDLICLMPSVMHLSHHFPFAVQLIQPHQVYFSYGGVAWEWTISGHMYTGLSTSSCPAVLHTSLLSTQRGGAKMACSTSGLLPMNKGCRKPFCDQHT